MGLIDSHAHLTYPGLVDRVDEVMTNCRNAGIEKVICVGTTPTDALNACQLAEKFAGEVHAAAAFHPHHAAEATEDQFELLWRIWKDPKVVAFGEMGLDYHYDHSPRDVQKSVFSRQLTAAREYDRPIIIHCREAFEDCVPLLLDHGFANRRVVFHCFTGTAAEAATLAKHGWRISFTGIVTFKKSTWLHDIAREYPADQLMVETDSPYLAPEPLRGRQPNEPAWVAHVARYLAKLRGCAYEELVETTSQNTRQFFGLEA